MDYLKPFVEIARNHAAATLAGIAIKKAQDTCRCASYPFPHRSGGGDCTAPNPFACPRCHGFATDEDGEKVRCTYCRGTGMEA